MDATALSDAARALIAARRTARPLGDVPAAWEPGDLESAYALQRVVAEEFGETRGWKVSGLTSAQQGAMGIPCPIGGPLPARWFQTAPASFALTEFIRPRLECEYAFALSHDLPARTAAYSRAEVAAAIGAMHIAIEIVDSRLPAGSPFLLELADGFNNGAFVLGPSVADWRGFDLASRPIALRATVDGVVGELAHGNATPILGGDPVGAVVLLANHPAHGTGGLRAGEIITTGTCTGAVPVPGRSSIEADFGALGRVRLSFE